MILNEINNKLNTETIVVLYLIHGVVNVKLQIYVYVRVFNGMSLILFEKVSTYNNARNWLESGKFIESYISVPRILQS